MSGIGNPRPLSQRFAQAAKSPLSRIDLVQRSRSLLVGGVGYKPDAALQNDTTVPDKWTQQASVC